MFFLKQKLFRLSIFLMLCFSASGLFAQHSETQNYNQKATRLQYEPDLFHVSNSRTYINPNHISCSSTGLYLKAGANLFHLPVLFSDTQGCYLDSKHGIPVACGRCGYKFEITELVTSCPNCGYGG